MREFIRIVESCLSEAEGEREPIRITLKPKTPHDPEGPAAKFFKDYLEGTDQHPIDRHSRLYGYSSLIVRKSIDHPNNAVYISDIMSLEAGKGHGSVALKALCELADEHGVTLELTAKAYGPKHLSTKQLVDWYSRYGFTVSRRGNAESGTSMVRKPHHAPKAKPLDENEEMPSIVYHGTTLNEWEGHDGEGTMFFTSNRADAVIYAEEAAEGEHYRKHEGDEIEDPAIKPIVVEFRLADLKTLEAKGSEFQPDWGWVDGHKHAEGEIPTWVESFQHVGSFCIEPFKHAYKAMGKITPATAS